MIHTVKGFGIVNKAEVDVFLEFSCFLMIQDVGNLISGSSAFSKSSLYVWKFSVHVLLEPSLKDFEHYLASMWNEHKWYYEYSLALPFWGIGMKTNTFQSCGHWWVFQICWHTVCSTLTYITVMLNNSLPWKWTKIILLFLRLPPNTAFRTLLWLWKLLYFF